jgi:hypothetical protein
LIVHAFASTPALAEKTISEELTPPPSAAPELLRSVGEIHTMLRTPFKEREALLRAMLDPSRGPLSIIDCQLAAHAGYADMAYENLFAALDAGAPLVTRSFFTGKTARAYMASSLFTPYFHALRKDIRFPQLCARMGLVDYFVSSGIWPDCADQVPYDFRAECMKWLKV